MSSIVRRQVSSARFSPLLVSSFHHNSMRLLRRIAFFNFDVILGRLNPANEDIAVCSRPFSYIRIFILQSYTQLMLRSLNPVSGYLQFFHRFWVVRIFILDFSARKFTFYPAIFMFWRVILYVCLQHYTLIEYAVCLRTALGFVQIFRRV